MGDVAISEYVLRSSHITIGFLGPKTINDDMGSDLMYLVT